MTRRALTAQLIVGGALFLTVMPLHAEAATPAPKIGPGWAARIDPWHQVPSELAIRFGRAAVAGGLTAADAAGLLNDDRFVAAVGAPDQGWGLLEAMTEQPAVIVDAYMLLQDGTDYTVSGTTSFQYAFFLRHPELRNAYLADLGHMIAARPDGVEVLVDVATGRQIVSRYRLGIPIRAPGGGPLPVPSISPEEAAAQMWEDVGLDPDDPEARALAAPPANGLPRNTDPGASGGDGDGLLSPGLFLVAGAFLVSWLGFAAVMVLRRVRGR
jgi:hypothetical protein